jgi:hypothetical protein
MREPSEEMVEDPYSTFIAPGLRQGLLGGNDFGQRNKVLLNRFITIQKQKQKQTLGIKYIPILIFELEEKNGKQNLSFIISEPSSQNDLFRTSKRIISADNQSDLELNFRTTINTLLNQWNNFLDNSTYEEKQEIPNKIDLSFDNFFNELNDPTIDKSIEELYSKENNFGNDDYVEDDYVKDDYVEDDYVKDDYVEDDYVKDDYPQDTYKPKKFGKISDMNKEELREYVINKFGQSYYNEYEPQVYTTKTGFGNVRYVKRSSPLTELGTNIQNYDYSMENFENSDVNLFD